ncbi:MAG TPA: hypothetical protein VMA35_13390 [Candidatus Sulfopaludibacter sp.]|nr:hypothetical protein [Candidatus Sulfopaludibacter sp.]
MRWLCFLICAVLGLALLACGLLVPMHLRAVDAGVLERAGRNGPALLEEGKTLIREQKLGTAQMLVQAARLEAFPGWDRLDQLIASRAQQNPAALAWGNDTRVEKLFAVNVSTSKAGAGPFTDFIVRQENRAAALASLNHSSQSAVQELMRSRSLTRTVLLPPSGSASGQAFDAAVSLCGLLSDNGHLTVSLNRRISALAEQANQGGDTRPLEEVLMDFLSLGERFNWDQLVTFVAQIPDPGTLNQLAGEARNAGTQLPVLFAAVELSGKPVAVAGYLAKFSETGLKDLGASLAYGGAGVGELAQRGQRFYRPDWERRVTAFESVGNLFYRAADYGWQQPQLALAAKWLAYLLAGFLLAAALHFARPAVSPLERPLQVRGFHLVREFLFSLGFLFVVLLLSEPFLAQESQKGGFSFRLLPLTTGGVVPAGIAGIQQTIMNPIILLTLLLFFVLQALLYTACLVKLAEIRRQRVPPRMKLRLLENEDHLFDAGLYLGFVGTIISLIVASMGLVHFSLMAAYSSTSFGIVFVVIFKIFHLRPARRKLLLEAEAEAPGAAAGYVPPATASTPAYQS